MTVAKPAIDIDRKQSFQDSRSRVPIPLPIFMLQPILRRIVVRTVQRRPEFFRRLGVNRYRTYLIDPVNLPFALILRPDPDRPGLRAYRRNALPPYDSRVAGTFMTLLDMVDGRRDGDALFFTRDLLIEGDTEAVVTLRNAIDDLEGSIMDDVADIFGPLSRVGLRVLRRVRG